MRLRRHWAIIRRQELIQQCRTPNGNPLSAISDSYMKQKIAKSTYFTISLIGEDALFELASCHDMAERSEQCMNDDFAAVDEDVMSRNDSTL